jgi:hypothetical protein
VVCDELSWLHFEVKAVERLNIEEAMEQARRDAAKSEGRNPKSEVLADCHHPKSEIRKVPIVAHRRNFRPWLVTMEAETFFRLLRGDFTEGNPDGSGRCALGNEEVTAEAEVRPPIAKNAEEFSQKGTKKTKKEFGDAVEARAGQANVPTDAAENNNNEERKDR